MTVFFRRLLALFAVIALFGCTTTVQSRHVSQIESATAQGSLSPTPVGSPTSIEVEVTPTPIYTIPKLPPTRVPILPGTQPNNVFGISLTPLDDSGGFPQAMLAGFKWTRGGFIWSSIEPTPGERIWDASIERELVRLASANVQPIMLIEGTPGWAIKPGFLCGAVAENQFQLLGQFAYDLVKRYSAPPYQVHYWELWNEPDAAGILGCWGDPSDQKYYGGEYYGQMLKVVYPRIKAADPYAQVLVGGLLLDCDPNHPPAGKDCTSSRFLEGILAGGGGVDFDGVSFHAYDYYTGKGTYNNPNWNSSSRTTGPVSIIKAQFLKSVLLSYGYGEKYLVNTETAVFWGKNVLEPPCDPNAPKDIEATKVDYVVQSFAAAVAEGWKANIWYSATGARCSGLLNSDLSPKEAFYAYQYAELKLAEALFLRPVSEFQGVMGYEYKIPGGILWVVWLLDTQARIIDLPGLPSEASILNENGLVIRQPTALSITVTSSPIFITFDQ